MKLKDIRIFLFSTIRGRIILSVALVHAIMMSLFIVDLVIRQQNMVLDQKEKEAFALAQSFSTSASIWIVAKDVSGLQELVRSQNNYPDLLYTIITDDKGFILAHTDETKRGLYLKDLPIRSNSKIFEKSPKLVDVIVPVSLNKNHIGWIRLGINNKQSIEKIKDITITGIIYAIIAIVTGSIIAWFMGKIITSRLYIVQNTISEVRKGKTSARSDVKGYDEAASISFEFNNLLDNLVTQQLLLSTIINSVTDIVIFSLDKNYCYTAFNEKHRLEMKKVWNMDVEIGMNLLDCMHIDELKQMAKISMDRVLSGESFVEIQHQPGPAIYYEFNWNPIFQNKEVVGITAFIRDITKQKLNEAQIIKLNRIYSVLSNINQAIVRIHKPHEMMREACRIAVEYGKFQMSWIGIVDTHNNKVDVVADFGNAGDYLKEINIDLKDDKRNTGPTAIAVLTERHKISNNILLDDNMTPWHKGALKYGYKSSASFPLIVNQKVIGVFNLYSCDTDFFQEDDIKLLDEIAIDISFAFEFSEIEVEKKRIEDTLKESEKKYRTLIQKIQSAVVVHGVDTKIITCNAKAQELLGLSEDQLLGKTAIDPGWHFYREDRTIASLEGYPVNCVITSRKALRNEIYGIHRPNNKNDVWVLVNADPVFDNNGNLVQIIVTFNDITERKHIEEALQSSKAELSALINSMTDVLIVVSSEGRYMKIAETNPSLLYKPPKELLGKTLHEVFSREQADKFLKYVKEALYNAKPINFEYSLLIEEKEFWFNATVSPMSEDSVLLVAKDITERKSMEVALSKGEERFRMVFENSPVSIWEENFSEIKNLFDSLKKINITDIENYFNSYPEILIQCAEKVKITDVNSAALSLHEASTKQELVENLANTFTNESFIAFRKELVCLWNGGTKMQVEASVKTLAGKPRNVSVYFSVCPGYEDTLSKVIVSLIDITDRKQAENALKESERRYRDIFDNILDGLYLLELTKEGHFKTIEVNPALERLTGIPRSFSVGKIQEEIVPVEVAEIVNNKYRKCIQLNQAIEEIVTLDLPVGKRIFSSTLIPATDINENIYRIVGISRDITNIREVEQKLNLLNFALNNVYDEAYLINEKSGFDYVNDECCKALGYSKVELLEMSVSDIDPDFPFERWQEHWNFIMQHGSMVFESLHKTKEGKIYPVEISANYFEYNGKGYNLAMCRNISERKIAEAEIKKLNQELEKRVIERTSQLEIANKELEAFAYSVSHDLRAPLRGIDGFSQVLLNEYKDKIDDQGRNYLQRVCSAAQRMAQLIDDILSLSRVSRSEMDIRLVNLSGLAKEIAGNLMEMQPDRKVEFVIEEGIEAKGDSRLLRIVLENLLGNAWKFTSKHPKACIEFRLLQLDRKPVYLIRDDGAGFQMDFVPKLFGAFQRLHDSNEFPGTGIGLATVQRIIHRHGGEVWAKGEVEKGAEFYFTLS